MRHVILRSFEGEKNRWLVRMSKTRRFCRNRPEQVTDPLREPTAKSRGGYLAAGTTFGAIQQIEIWFLDTSLGCEHQDGFARHALREQITHPFDGRGRFSGTHWAGDEEFGVQRGFDDLTLKRTKADSERKVGVCHRDKGTEQDK